VLFWFVLLAAYWAWSIAAFVASARQATKMAQLLHGKLGISPRELQTIEWHEVVGVLACTALYWSHSFSFEFSINTDASLIRYFPSISCGTNFVSFFFSLFAFRSFLLVLTCLSSLHSTSLR
jgi:hypothetical protein